MKTWHHLTQHSQIKLNYHSILRKLTTLLFLTLSQPVLANGELCQLSAIDETGLHIFSEYILPLGTVSYGASRVNKLSVRTINGKQRLYNENHDQPVGTLTLEQALHKFLTILGNVKYTGKSESLTIIIGNNSSVFDTPILLHKSSADFHSKLIKMNVCLLDSQILINPTCPIDENQYNQYNQ